MTTEQKKQASAEEYDSRSPNNPRFRWWDTPADRYAAALAVATILLCVVTGALYCATRDLVNDARDSAKRQLRAYVTIQEMPFFSRTEKSKPQNRTISVIWKNTGSTPTRNFVSKGNCQAGRPFIYGASSKENDRWALSRDQTIEAPLCDLTFSQIDETQKGKVITFLYGEATYDDVFGPHEMPHVTRFCVQMDAPYGKPDSDGLNAVMRPCPAVMQNIRTNCVDEECSKQP